MKTGYVQFRYRALALWGVTALFSASAALAAPNPSEAQARYQQERAMCETRSVAPGPGDLLEGSRRCIPRGEAGLAR